MNRTPARPATPSIPSTPSTQSGAPRPSSEPALAALGWDDGHAAALRDLTEASTHAGTGLHPARVARVDRGAVDLLGAPVARAVLAAPVAATAASDPLATPCVGDWVLVRPAPQRGREEGVGVVEHVLPRRTAFVRATAGESSHGQVLAANVDLAVVVEPLLPEPELGRIERFLALAWESGATPVVVLTKADLVPDAEDVRADVAAGAPGVDVHVVSTRTGQGIQEMRALLAPGATLVLLGRSGAGKSSLTNALAGAEVMVTQEIRGDGKGRHTTVHRELVLLPGGGLVVDTPGLRGVGLTAVEAESLERVFADVEELAAACRFADCAHASEPGCAVLEAVEAGELPERRLASWRRLQREAHWMASRHDARLRAEERARWKRIAAESRGRIRP